MDVSTDSENSELTYEISSESSLNDSNVENVAQQGEGLQRQQNRVKRVRRKKKKAQIPLPKNKTKSQQKRPNSAKRQKQAKNDIQRGKVRHNSQIITTSSVQNLETIPEEEQFRINGQNFIHSSSYLNYLKQRQFINNTPTQRLIANMSISLLGTINYVINYFQNPQITEDIPQVNELLYSSDSSQDESLDSIQLRETIQEIIQENVEDLDYIGLEKYKRKVIRVIGQEEADVLRSQSDLSELNKYKRVQKMISKKFEEGQGLIDNKKRGASRESQPNINKESNAFTQAATKAQRRLNNAKMNLAHNVQQNFTRQEKLNWKKLNSTKRKDFLKFKQRMMTSYEDGTPMTYSSIEDISEYTNSPISNIRTLPKQSMFSLAFELKNQDMLNEMARAILGDHQKPIQTKLDTEESSISRSMLFQGESIETDPEIENYYKNDRTVGSQLQDLFGGKRVGIDYFAFGPRLETDFKKEKKEKQRLRHQLEDNLPDFDNRRAINLKQKFLRDQRQRNSKYANYFSQQNLYLTPISDLHPEERFQHKTKQIYNRMHNRELLSSRSGQPVILGGKPKLTFSNLEEQYLSEKVKKRRILQHKPLHGRHSSLGNIQSLSNITQDYDERIYLRLNNPKTKSELASTTSSPNISFSLPMLSNQLNKISRPNLKPIN